jgi:hypothetical protein
MTFPRGTPTAEGRRMIPKNNELMEKWEAAIQQWRACRDSYEALKQTFPADHARLRDAKHALNIAAMEMIELSEHPPVTSRLSG